MASIDASTVLGWLRAAGEDSRLRLLALCARQDLSVSDLAEALRQSEPRVSRHLRILCEAGLLERLRQGQWVHYRLTQNAGAANFVQTLLAQVDRNDPLFVRDRERAFGRPLASPNTGVTLAMTLAERAGRRDEGGHAGAARQAGDGTLRARGSAWAASGDGAVAGAAGSVSGRGPVAGGTGSASGGAGVVRGAGDAARVRTGESRLGKALREVVERVTASVAPEARKSALVVGVEHLELLESVATGAGECVAIAHSRRAAQSARAFAERRGFACRVLVAASSAALCARDVAGATERLARESPAGTGGPFDMVVLDHLAVPDSGVESLLDYGRRALASDGRLWLFERYESLEVSREKVVEHPIGRLRRMLGDVGLSCERLSPIEADGQHVLAAVAVPSRGVSRGTGAAGAA